MKNTSQIFCIPKINIENSEDYNLTDFDKYDNDIDYSLLFEDDFAFEEINLFSAKIMKCDEVRERNKRKDE